MKTIVTISSKGQFTLPSDVRRSMDLKKGDRLEVSFDEDLQRITLTRVAAIADLSARVSSYAKRTKPVTDVDAYYQTHRAEESKP
ncbi:AbrB/MazE/SpoVT family DNA-binding domain-containing protein [Arthrobacter sp. H14]|uniref:AbrB/MazE/SpoVT family DNA-binding domain-containing protein n=1 Tax=Arthrobacter sp. H14 TaxID=1312959 RepID=UPI0004B160C7|nr:AbrB/MazE/SpoVT family DNA-binding domain-containing protein [Arthrobacter sp. H14]